MIFSPKVKLLTLSVAITTGLCISVSLATPVLLKNHPVAMLSSKDSEALPASELDEDYLPSAPKSPQGARRSYAS